MSVSAHSPQPSRPTVAENPHCLSRWIWETAMKQLLAKPLSRPPINTRKPLVLRKYDFDLQQIVHDENIYIWWKYIYNYFSTTQSQIFLQSASKAVKSPLESDKDRKAEEEQRKGWKEGKKEDGKRWRGGDPKGVNHPVQSTSVPPQLRIAFHPFNLLNMWHSESKKNKHIWCQGYSHELAK